MDKHQKSILFDICWYDEYFFATFKKIYGKKPHFSIGYNNFFIGYNNFFHWVLPFEANLIMLAHGCIVSWVSPALGKLTSEDTPLLTGPLTVEQMSWIGSIHCLGALLGSISLGYVVSIVGCKRAMLFLTIPSVAFWILVYFGNVYYHILIARVTSGWAGGAIQAVFVLYIAEIANDQIRGRLASSGRFSY